MEVNTVGIIGYGKFGAFLVQLIQGFFPEVEVRIYSRHMGDGVAPFTTLEKAAASDVVVLCGAISNYEEQLQALLPHTRPDTILVDVATVKGYPAQVFEKYAADRRWIATHPMFGPESYQKKKEDVSGFRIVITDYTLPNDTFLLLKNMLGRLGFVVIEMTADEHDQLLAETLFLTHFMGQIVSQAGYGRTNIDTTSFSYLMDAVESVQNDEKLFADVYKYNPYCQAVLEKLTDTRTKIVEQLQEQD